MTNQLKLSFLSFLLVPAILFGQVNNFNFVQHDTSYVGSDSFIELIGSIFSLIDTDQSVTVTKVEQYRPTEWSVFFCAGPACLPDFVNSFTFTLAAGDTGYFSVEAYTNSTEGSGAWTFFTVDSSTMEVDSIHVTMDVVTVGVDDKNFTPGGFKLSPTYPNPSNAWINFDIEVESQGNYSVTLHSLDGRVVITRDYHLQPGKNHLAWSLGNLSSGQYILTANNNGNVHAQKLIVVK